MIKSKKVYFVLSIFLLIFIYYFATNPYLHHEYECEKSNIAVKQKLVINVYLPRSYEVIFKSQIYPAQSCLYNESLTCILLVENYETGRISFNKDQLTLEHHWERYESGEFVYDQTQIIKTKMQDFYTCE